ncbi:MAG TPA: hypothetical protein VKV04_09465 [Verrucomicrobiae bacterium]|nr:hypothetical protein [Verrucomicrobiae bacterium]
MNIKQIICLAAVFGFCVWGQAQCSITNVTLFVSAGTTGGTNANVIYNVQSGQIAKIVYAAVTGQSLLEVDLSNSVYTNASLMFTSTNNLSNDLPVIAGPATISLIRNGNTVGNSVICTVEISTPSTSSSSSFVPSTAIVIPADSGGSVNIILESSPDLVSWYPSLPGTYGADYTNRFFRVRAQLAQ